MEDLKQLSNVVTAYRIKKLDVLDLEDLKSDNNYATITHALAHDLILTDDEAACLIKMEKKNFRSFKTRLKDKLLNSLLFLDLENKKSEKYSIAIDYCSKNQHTIRLLLLLNARGTAIQLAKQTLQKALEFELAEYVLFCSRILRTNASLEGNNEHFLRYKNIHSEYSEISKLEEESVSLFDEINALAVNATYPDKEISLMAMDHCEQIERFLARHDTYQIRLNYYRVKALSQHLAYDFEAELQTWKAYDTHILKYAHFEPEPRYAESALHQMVNCLHLKDYELGSWYAEKCERLFKPFSGNWLVFREYYFLLAMHSKRYDAAEACLFEILAHEKFKHMLAKKQEQWKIMEAYYLFYIKSMDEDLNYKKAALHNFRFSKFFESIVVQKKEKEGFNIALLILDIMLWFQKQDYATLGNKIFNLKSYSHRYLTKQKGSYRSSVFIKMLLQTHYYNFDRVKVLEKSKKHVDCLSSPIQSKLAHPDGLEIIPFLDLWDIVVRNLKKN